MKFYDLLATLGILGLSCNGVKQLRKYVYNGNLKLIINIKNKNIMSSIIYMTYLQLCEFFIFIIK